ncbi:hypothetical protein BT69DRAFT_1352642 [Atractiella rhizophila]|nr:hypothetical protein BT69DRAFT_1284482 [Atractiella rhizophila]KAH8920148.1 hypothetical protein BT69DRAFT_1352642 [Atractiella rhizophila]
MALRHPSDRFRHALISPTSTIPHLNRLAEKLENGIENPDFERKTSLALAVEHGRLDVARWLLEIGHEDREISRDFENNTILHIAAAHDQLDIIELYVSFFPYVLDWSNSRGFTPLHVACQKGKTECAAILLDLGADIDLPDSKGNTPLHHASMWGHLPIVKLLIERGCSFASKNNDHFTASEYAYSFEVMNKLQEYGRAYFESSKRQRKQKHRDREREKSDRPAGSSRSHRLGNSASSNTLNSGFVNGAEDDSASIVTTREVFKGRLRKESGSTVDNTIGSGIGSSVMSSGLSGRSGSLSINGTSPPVASANLPSSASIAGSLAASSTVVASPMPRPAPLLTAISTLNGPIPAPSLSPASISSVRKTLNRDQQAMAVFKADVGRSNSVTPLRSNSALDDGYLEDDVLGTPTAASPPVAPLVGSLRSKLPLRSRSVSNSTVSSGETPSISSAKASAAASLRKVKANVLEGIHRHTRSSSGSSTKPPPPLSGKTLSHSTSLQSLTPSTPNGKINAAVAPLNVLGRNMAPPKPPPESEKPKGRSRADSQDELGKRLGVVPKEDSGFAPRPPAKD